MDKPAWKAATIPQRVEYRRKCGTLIEYAVMNPAARDYLTEAERTKVEAILAEQPPAPILPLPTRKQKQQEARRQERERDEQGNEKIIHVEFRP